MDVDLQDYLRFFMDWGHGALAFCLRSVVLSVGHVGLARLHISQGCVAHTHQRTSMIPTPTQMTRTLRRPGTHHTHHVMGPAHARQRFHYGHRSSGAGVLHRRSDLAVLTADTMMTAMTNTIMCPDRDTYQGVDI